MKVDPVLNWAERRTFWVMISAWLLGFGIAHLVQGHWLLGWLLLVPGLGLTTIRPVSTHLRRRFYDREVQKLIGTPKKVDHE